MVEQNIGESEAVSSIKRSVREYASKQSVFASYCNEMARITSEVIKIEEIRVQNVQCRVKSIESFEKKCSRYKINNDNGRAELVYREPINEITDLSAIRVIAYTLKDVRRICSLVEENFEVVEKKDLGEDRFYSGRFGYQSIHYLVKLPPVRRSLPELAQYTEMICEIQIRTVLQHAWAEMEHDIQYKSSQELPKSIQKKFLSLAGLIEIADREFQSIQDEDVELKSSIQRSLQDDLTREAISEGRLSKTKNVYVNKGKNANSSIRVRKLIAIGKYADAIEIYDDLIEAEPAAHTLYVGRAKAKFLAGDRVGALDDIYQAEQINSNDPHVSYVKNRMIEGEFGASGAQITAEASSIARMGKDALDAGKGVEAFEYYSQAEEKGYNKAFSIINKSIACFLSRDFDGARYFISQLKEIPGTPMQVNILALRAMLDFVGDGEGDEAMDKLRTTVHEKLDFSFDISPLRSIYLNIKNFPENERDGIVAVLDALRRSD